MLGLYLAGINEETVVDAARHFGVLDDRFRRVPVYLDAAEDDAIATLADHRRIEHRLQRAGFEHVRLATRPGTHAASPETLAGALDWFRELARDK